MLFIGQDLSSGAHIGRSRLISNAQFPDLVPVVKGKDIFVGIFSKELK